MSEVIFNSRTADKFVVRLPDGMRDEVDAVATGQSTSMNSIFIRATRQFLAGQQRQELLLDALEHRLAAVDADRVNRVAREGENVNQAMGFDLDEHARMAVDARRYRWLRDRDCIEDVDSDLMVLRGDTHFTGAELDKEIDDAIRLDVLEAEPCKP